MAKRAFTLIELLVVIAIIAILAAILFPVFAQAKEAAKKTASLSNAKQTGTGIILYTADNDDNFPSVYGIEADGTIAWDSYNGYPAGWDTALLEARDAQAWGNSIQPYMKNLDLLEAPGIQKVNMTAEFGAAAYANPRKPPKPTALTMNGLLNTYTATAVAQPSRLTMLWYGMGKENLVGAVNMQPALVCNGTPGASCRFNPGGAPQAGATGSDTVFLAWTDATDSVWYYSQGQNMVQTDTSAKFRKLGGSVGSTVNSYFDPYRSYGRKGEYWLTIHRCVSAAGSPRYSSFFRPDSEFNYQFGNSATTLCFP